MASASKSKDSRLFISHHPFLNFKMLFFSCRFMLVLMTLAKVDTSRVWPLATQEDVLHAASLASPSKTTAGIRAGYNIHTERRKIDTQWTMFSRLFVHLVWLYDGQFVRQLSISNRFKMSNGWIFLRVVYSGGSKFQRIINLVKSWRANTFSKIMAVT